MKKKVFILTLALAATALFAMAWTGAYFTGSAETTGHKVTTGPLTISAWSDIFNVQNLEPGAGYVNAGYVHVSNDGKYDMKWRMGLNNISDPANLASKVEVKCTLNPDEGHKGNYGPNGSVVWDCWLSQLDGWNNIAVCDSSVAADPFKPGNDAWYLIQVKLDASAGNALQNATYKADIAFGATQWINPGWTE